MTRTKTIRCYGLVGDPREASSKSLGCAVDTTKGIRLTFKAEVEKVGLAIAAQRQQMLVIVPFYL